MPLHRSRPGPCLRRNPAPRPPDSRDVADCAGLFDAAGSFDPADLPEARVDPIVDAATALALVRATSAVPARFETIVVLLDHLRCGVAVANFVGTVDHDSVFDVADAAVEIARRDPSIDAAVIASIRPGTGGELGDVDRWLDLDEQLAVEGIELVEWFVVDDGVSRPRTLLGEPSRWTP